MADLVIDASIAARWFLPDEQDREADELRSRLDEGRDTAYAPPHFRPELYSLFYRASQVEGRFDEEDLRLFVSAIPLLPIKISEPAELYERATEIGLTHRILGHRFDLVYLALAERQGAELWTGDEAFAQRVGEPHRHLIIVKPSTRRTGHGRSAQLSQPIARTVVHPPAYQPRSPRGMCGTMPPTRRETR